MATCGNGHWLKRCKQCGVVGCEHDTCTYRKFHNSHCEQCGHGWSEHFNPSQEDHDTRKISSGGGGIPAWIATAIGIFIIAFHYWWITLPMLIAVGVGIAIYFSFKNRNRTTYPTYQEPLYQPFVEKVHKIEPTRSRLREFKYKWSFKGQEFIGAYKCKDEQVLKNHVAGVGGTLIEILGPSGMKENVEDSVTNSINNACASEGAIANINDLNDKKKSGPVTKKYSEMELARMFNYPEILPCAFDQSMYAWAERIKHWGTPIIVYYNPMSRQKENLTLDGLLNLMNDPESMSTFESWNVKKLNYKSVEFLRDYKGMDGKSYRARVVLDIDLKDSIKEIMKFKF